jgi:hypothetical protein
MSKLYIHFSCEVYGMKLMVAGVGNCHSGDPQMEMQTQMQRRRWLLSIIVVRRGILQYLSPGF